MIKAILQWFADLKQRRVARKKLKQRMAEVRARDPFIYK